MTADPLAHPEEVIFDEDGAYVASPDWAALRASDAQERADRDFERRHVPPEYRGQTWPYRVLEYVDGEPVERIINSPFPPYRNDPQGPLTDAFIDFQNYASRNRRQAHPGWYCTTCGQSLGEQSIRGKRTTCPRCRISDGTLTQAEWERQHTAWLKTSGRLKAETARGERS